MILDLRKDLIVKEREGGGREKTEDGDKVKGRKGESYSIFKFQDQ